MIRTVMAIAMVLFTQMATAQVKPGTPQRLPPDQEYELLKERYHNLTRVAKPRSFHWEPRSNGRLNPLEFATLNEPLIFVNGLDGAQVAKAAETQKRYGGAAKIIVVGKAGPEVATLPKQKTYSDLTGKLAKKLQLQHGPALVTQEGAKLRIEEIVP